MTDKADNALDAPTIDRVGVVIYPFGIDTVWIRYATTAGFTMASVGVIAILVVICAV